MSLENFLNYIGFLIAAYGITQEYIRIKLRLGNKIYVLVFFLSLFLMFLSTFDWLKIELTQRAYIQILFYDFVWQSKYQIIVFVNLLSLYCIFNSTRLKKNNSENFYNLLYELKQDGKELILNKLIKENFTNIFKYKEYECVIYRIRLFLYYRLDPSDSHNKRINKKISQLAEEQKKYIENGGDISKLNTVGTLPNTQLTRFENIRKSLANYVKPYRENYFEKIYQLSFLDKNQIKHYKESDEVVGLEILRNIAKYEYFSESFEYIEKYLILNLSDRKSLLFKNLYHDKNNTHTKFIYDNQKYEDGFNLGYIICVVIAKLLEKYKNLLQKNIIDNEDNANLKHINQLYEILSRLDGDLTHLSSEPLYIQRTLVKYIDFTKNIEQQNMAFDIIRDQIHSMKNLASNSNEANNLKLFENLIENIFNIDNVSEEILVEIASVYVDYIFRINTDNKKIEKKNEEFKSFIVSSRVQKKLLNIYIKVFDINRREHDNDYISYTKNNKEFETYWQKTFNFLVNQYKEAK